MAEVPRSNTLGRLLNPVNTALLIARLRPIDPPPLCFAPFHKFLLRACIPWLTISGGTPSCF